MDVGVAVTRQPVSQSVIEGATVLFTVRAVPNEVSYQWRKDGHEVPGATRSSLRIESADEHESGVYDVVVGHGGACATSEPARLEVLVVDDDARDDEDDEGEIVETWDPPFALRAGIVTGACTAVMLLPLCWAQVAAITQDGGPDVLSVVSLAAAEAGTLAAAGALYVFLLQLRSRSALMEARNGTKGALTDVIAAAPDILRAFGKLSASAAFLATAVALFGISAALAWHLPGS